MCSTFLYVILWCLCGAGTVYASEGDCECPCPKPPERIYTKPPDAKNCCTTGSMFRYTCIDGYVREAGTSNLTKCKKTKDGKQWTNSNLKCIRDPKLSNITEQPAKTTTDHWVSTPSSKASPKSFIPNDVTTSAHTPKAATPPTSPTFSTESESQTYTHTDDRTFAHSLEASSLAPAVDTTSEPPTQSSLSTELDRATTPSPLCSSQAQAEVTLGPQMETKGTGGMFETSTSANAFPPTETESSNRNVSSRHGHMDTVGTGLGAVGVILLVAMTLLAISYWCRKRNSSQSPVPQSTVEERTAMNLCQL